MMEKLGFKILEPGPNGLALLRRRIDQRRRRVATLQAATALALVVATTVYLKPRQTNILPAWAAQHPALRVASRTDGRLLLTDGSQQALARSPAMTLYLIDTLEPRRQADDPRADDLP